MRLICPNCAAQYEVDAAVIPEAGRDVQCSNCGHTWWQERVAPAAETPAPADEPGPAAAAAAALAAAAGAAAAGAEPAGAAADWPEEDMQQAARAPLEGTEAPWPEAPDEHPAAPAQGAPTWPEAPPEIVANVLPGATRPPLPEVAPVEPESEPVAAAAAPARTPRSLDDAVLDVLREEADREARARRAEAVPTEAAAPATDPAVRDRFETPSGEADDAGRPERRLRRSKLPDVDEINSTLVSHQPATETAGRHLAAQAAAGRSGFRTGFTLMIVIAITIGALYSYADRIVAAAPGTAPAMGAFVRTIDAARTLLDKAAQNATVAISGLTDGN